MSELMQKSNNNVIIVTLSNHLKTILSENSEVEQCLAVQALGHMPPDQSLKILLEQLRNPDEDVRCDTGKSLALLQDKGAIPLLIENLIQDPVGEAKVIYIEALEALNAYESAQILSVLVSTRGEEKDVAWEEDGAGWDDWLDVQRSAIKALGSFGDKIDVNSSIEAILKALDDPDGQNLWALATKTLVKFGDEGSSSLLALMREASSLDRKRIAIALGDGTNEDSASLLEAALQDPEPSVRMAAIASGAKRELKEIYILGVGDGSADVRAKTVEEYKNLDDKTLETALNDDSQKVQTAACEAIIRDGKARPSLKLTQKAQNLLRKDEPQILSSLISAMAVAKPDAAAKFIEDIVNHSATEAVVRIAALRTLGSLNSSNSVALLSNAAGDENQEIRLAAIGSLGKIAKGEGALAEKAIDILAQAIAGDLVPTPKDWKPEEGNVVDFDKHKNLKQEERDQDSRMVKLDREGNIIDASKQPKIEDGVEIVEEKLEEVEPLSTLDAIMAANIDVPVEDNNIEIMEADIEFLEMTGSGPKKRKKISPINNTPAHLDVRRLAALVGCETGRGDLVEPLVKALGDNDKELSEAALDALVVLAQNGADISSAQNILLRHATTSETSLGYRAIRALSFIDASVVTKVIVKLTGDANDIVRAEAVRALEGRDTDTDLVDLCLKSGRLTRVAAANIISSLESTQAVPALFAFAFIEDGVHKQKAANLLKNHKEHALNTISELLSSDEGRKRIIGLDMLNSILSTGALKQV
jgi:HEAT repeat protein